MLDHLEIRPRYLDADRGLDAGSQHVDAGLDGGHPGVGETWETDEGVELLFQLLRGHAGAPLIAGLELDAGLHHHQIGRVGGGFGAPRLAEHVLHLGYGTNELVGLLQNLPRLAHRDIGCGGGHIHDVPLIERRNELGAQVLERPEARHRHHGGDGQGGFRAGQDGFEQRHIALAQPAVQRVGLLRQYLATDEVTHDHRHQRDGKRGGRRHGVGLGEGEGVEHPPLLRLQREHRQEADGDDQQGEEDGGPHFDARLGDDAPAVLVGERLPLHVFVDVLDHHDGAIHHGADGDGDAPERHDVGVDPLQVHDDKGHQNGDGQGDDHHQRRAQVEQEGEADQHHHGKLLHQLAGEVIDGALDKVGAIVHGDHLHPLRQAAFQLGEPRLDPVDGVLGILAIAHDDNAAHHFPFAIELGDAAPHLGPGDHICHIPQQQRGAAHIGTERDLLQILDAFQIAVGAHHVLRFRHLDDGGAGLLIALLDGGLDKGERDAVGAQLVRVDPHLILANHAAHGGDFGDPVHRLQLVLEEPVLQRGELAQVMLAGFVHQRVLIDPAHPGGIGAELGAGRGG